MTNKRIKIAMVNAGISQKKLSEILNMSETELSYIMKHELAVKTQNEIVKKIREWDALQKGE